MIDIISTKDINEEFRNDSISKFQEDLNNRINYAFNSGIECGKAMILSDLNEFIVKNLRSEKKYADALIAAYDELKIKYYK